MEKLTTEINDNKWLEHEQNPELPKTVAVGWSGGADSTALLLALKSAGHQVHAWHVDHGWRDCSKAETRMLAKISRGWGIPFYSAVLLNSAQSNREALARKGRYEQFSYWAQEQKLSTLCLGHHLDDQAETVYMRLLQGAGPGGCAGMQRERMLGNLRIVRPLLHLSGLELRAGLNRAGVDWLDDPSNGDMSIWRNRIRHRLFPAMKKAGISPQGLFLRWQQQAEKLAAELDVAADALLDDGDLQLSEDRVKMTKRVTMRWSEWVASSPAVRARILQKMMVKLFGEGVTPGRRHILLVEQWVACNGRGGLDLPRCRLGHCREYLHLESMRADFAG